jgi:predicted CoA-binding protein
LKYALFAVQPDLTIEFIKTHFQMLSGLRGRELLSRNEIEEIFTKYKTIAVVGLSREPDNDSHRVSAYLKAHGFRIIPVNPFADEILGEKSYKSLLDIPPEIQKTIEVVDIFRPSEDVPPIVEQAIKLKAMYGKPHVVWMQLGIVNEQAAEAAKKAGLTVVMNRCMMIEHSRLF